MNLSAQHKASAICLVISIVLLFVLLKINILNQKVVEDTFFKEETLVEVTQEPDKEKTQQELSEAETNQAFNENKKDLAQAYEVIAPPKDFDYEEMSEQLKKEKTSVALISETTNNQHKTKPISTKNRNAFNKANRILEQQKANTNSGGNKNSTVSYSLKNRVAYNLPIPVYLCDTNGIVVINISVNKNGKVASAKVNTSSSSSNGCLQEYAVKYAKRASFDLGTKEAQFGTITYQFQ